MENNDLKVEEFILRVPGFSEDEARGLGEEVALHVANGLPCQQRQRHLGALELRVNIPPGTSRSRITTLIAEAILRGLT